MEVTIERPGNHGGMQNVGTGTLDNNVLTTTVVLDPSTVYTINGTRMQVQRYTGGNKTEGGGRVRNTGTMRYLVRNA
jgi:hypothetical protein